MHRTNAMKTLAAAATRHGVDLPAPVVEAMEFDPGFPPLVVVRQEVTAEIVAAVGTKDFEKVRDAALLRVARAEAAAPLRTPVMRAGEAHARRVAVEHAAEIVAAFEPVLTPLAETLQAAAVRIPPHAGTDPSAVSRLEPDAYEAVHEARLAERALMDTAADLGSLIGVQSHAVTYQTTIAASVMARIAVIGELPSDRDSLRRVADAVFRSTYRVSDNFGGSKTVHWYAAAAGAGATFAAPDPERTAQTRDALLDALRPEPTVETGRVAVL